MPNIVTEASRVWGPQGAPKLPGGAHDQFSSEVMGLIYSVRSVLKLYPPDGRPRTPLLVVTDCQAIPGCLAKSYTHHPDLMDFIMETSPYKDMLFCTWWLGGDHMPADACSRAGVVRTRATICQASLCLMWRLQCSWGQTQGAWSQTTHNS